MVVVVVSLDVADQEIDAVGAWDVVVDIVVVDVQSCEPG